MPGLTPPAGGIPGCLPSAQQASFWLALSTPLVSHFAGGGAAHWSCSGAGGGFFPGAQAQVQWRKRWTRKRLLQQPSLLHLVTSGHPVPALQQWCPTGLTHSSPQFSDKRQGQGQLSRADLVSTALGLCAQAALVPRGKPRPAEEQDAPHSGVRSRARPWAVERVQSPPASSPSCSLSTETPLPGPREAPPCSTTTPTCSTLPAKWDTRRVHS